MTIISGVRVMGLSLMLSACAGKSVDGGNGQVSLVTAEQLQGCENVGSTHVSVADRLEHLQRIDGAVEKELLTLARTSAVQLGGNAIVEMTSVLAGSQSFAVFRCP